MRERERERGEGERKKERERERNDRNGRQSVYSGAVCAELDVVSRLLAVSGRISYI